MSRHEGVSCDSCLKSNFTGRRYKCLICFDYDLCADCFEDGVTSPRHQIDHPMQCILTRSDMELYFGGEILTSDLPQSFTCPYCRKMGFSDATLLEHVSAEHTETSLEVVCPICAGMPGGEPNLVTDDFAGHLTLEHRQGPREIYDEPSAIRHGGGVRRIPGRSLGGPRQRRSNMHFASTGLSPSGREPVDPIAELLSQLSGVRRGGASLQQLQMQMQIDRHQVAVSGAPRQLDRVPRRAPPIVSTSNQNAAMAELVSGNSGMTVFMGGSGFSSANTIANGSSASSRNNEWIVTASTSSAVNNQHSQSANLATNTLNARDSGVNANPLAITVCGSSAGISGNNSATNSGGGGGEGQPQFLLAKFMQPTLSETELADVERKRADRSQFVQSLLLSALCSKNLDIDKVPDHLNHVTSDTDSGEATAHQQKHEAKNEEDYKNQKQDDSITNNNAESIGESRHNTNNNVVSRVNQMQQTSPEDCLSIDEYKLQTTQQQQMQQLNQLTQSTIQQQQQQQQQQTNSYNSTKKRSSTNIQGSVGSRPIADRGAAERRGRPPPPPASASVSSSSNRSSQTVSPAQHKYKQQNSSSNTTMATVKPMPDTR